MKLAGLLLSSDAHHIDHLAPLCALLSIPLVTDCSLVHAACKSFYPGLITIKKDALELPLWILNSYTHLITTIAKPLVDLLLFPHQDLMGKTIATFWCPHGFSDKGASIPFFEALKEENGLFYYGRSMLEVFKAKVPHYQEKQLFSLGNYRLQYTRAHQDFYQKLIKEMVPSGKKIALYAPTWNDSEHSSSVDTLLPHLTGAIPSHIHLILRLHPNTLKKGSKGVKKALEKAKSHPQITLAHHLPISFALLFSADIFIGDRSSVGYDFLSLNRPMLFAPGSGGNPSSLFKCGSTLQEKDYPHIFSLIEKALKEPISLVKEKRALYNQVFDQDPNFLTCMSVKAPL